jgi:hypothetical protein
MVLCKQGEQHPKESRVPRVTMKDDAVLPDMDEQGKIENFVKDIKKVVGTQNADLAAVRMQQLFYAQKRPNKDSAPYLNADIAAVNDLQPQDAAESMMAVQMVAIHNQCMELLKFAAKSTFIDGRKQYLNLAIKLSRTYTSQMEGLRRYRQKGQQRMTVEHVHVHEGGQAVVGQINHDR